ENTPKFAYTLKVGVLIGNGFNGNEVKSVLNVLQQYGVFVVIVSETLGTVTGDDGTKLKVDETFLTASPYFFDSLYVVGGNSKNEEKFDYDLNEYIKVAYEHYNPIGVATTAESDVHALGISTSPGVVFATNSPNFGEEFVTAVAQQRFWDRV